MTLDQIKARLIASGQWRSKHARRLLGATPQCINRWLTGQREHPFAAPVRMLKEAQLAAPEAAAQLEAEIEGEEFILLRRRDLESRIACAARHPLTHKQLLFLAGHRSPPTPNPNE